MIGMIKGKINRKLKGKRKGKIKGKDKQKKQKLLSLQSFKLNSPFKAELV